MITETAEIQNIYDDVTALQEQVAALTAQVATITEQVVPHAIAENTNLNDLTVGEYIIPSATICGTLTNKPITSNATGYIKVSACGTYGQLIMRYFICQKESVVYYQRAFYLGEWGSWNEVDLTDSGWIDLTLAEGVNPYTEGSKPQYRKIGNKVYLIGAVKNILNYDTVIATLPAGFRPVRTGHSYVQNTSYSNNAANFSRITIETNGNIEIHRISSGASFGADKWFPVHTEFLAD